MAIQIAPKPSKLEAQKALLTGRAPLPAPKEVIAAVGKLPAMIKDAAKKLATAATAAEILDVIDATGLAYDASKRAGRIAKAKGAHDTVVAAAHRAQADALDIESAAKRRLADEYDGAQERGEVAKSGRAKTNVPDQNILPAKVEEIGLTRKDVHEARRVRNAELARPGVVKAALDNAIAQGAEPSRAVINEAVAEALGETKPTDTRTDEDREYADLLAAWNLAGQGARDRFVAFITPSMESHEAGNGTEGVVPSPVKPVAGRSGRQAANSGRNPQSDGGAIAAVTGKAQLANANSVEPPPSDAFTNPRCQQPDTCHFVHTRDDCFDCSLAWSKRPKDEQIRLWAEANEAAKVAA